MTADGAPSPGARLLPAARPRWWWSFGPCGEACVLTGLCPNPGAPHQARGEAPRRDAQPAKAQSAWRYPTFWRSRNSFLPKQQALETLLTFLRLPERGTSCWAPPGFRARAGGGLPGRRESLGAEVRDLMTPRMGAEVGGPSRPPAARDASGIADQLPAMKPSLERAFGVVLQLTTPVCPWGPDAHLRGPPPGRKPLVKRHLPTACLLGCHCGP